METQYISLNMTPTGVNPCFHISQYDVGRMLGFIVHSGGATVDLDTYTCTIEATRSDGTAITSAVATTDNIGTFEVTPTMSNKTDKYRCQLVIVDENSKRIASLPFDMDVCKAAMDENSESIEEEASLYQQYTEAVQGAIAEANADIQAEENARIAAVSAEATARQNADATLQNKIDTEATARQTADNTLQGNINSEASTRATADTGLQAQINQIVAPSGAAPSAAEVQNARIGADNVTYPTLGDAIRGQVTDLKSHLSEIDNTLEINIASENLWNPAEEQTDKAISNASATLGQLVTNNGYTTSGFISAKKDDVVRWDYSNSSGVAEGTLISRGASVLRFAEYDVNKDCLLVTASWETLPYTVQNSSTKYIRVSVATKPTNSIIFGDSSTNQIAYEPFKIDSLRLIDIETDISDIQNNKIPSEQIEKSRRTYTTTSDKVGSTYAKGQISDKHPLTYTISNNRHMYLSILSIDFLTAVVFTVNSTSQQFGRVLVIADSEEYGIVGYSVSDIEANNISFISFDSSTRVATVNIASLKAAYPFASELWVDSKAEAGIPIVTLTNQQKLADYKWLVTDDVRFALPSKMLAVVGLPTWVYFENVLANGFLKDYLITTESTQKTRREAYKHNATSAGETTKTITIFDKTRAIKSATLKIKTVNKTASQVSNVKVLCIGDSKTEATGKRVRINELAFNDDKLNVTFIGTRGSSPTLSEGYSGTNIIDLCQSETLGSATNIFYDSTIADTNKFNFSKGITTIGEVPDIVFIDFGANQLGGIWSTIEGCYETVIDSIQSYNANIKIVICVQESTALATKYDYTQGNKIPYGYGNGSRNYAIGKMIHAFDNREAENVFLCPQYLCVDLYNDYPLAMLPTSECNDMKTLLCVDAVHCGTNINSWNANTQYEIYSYCKRNNVPYAAIRASLGIDPEIDDGSYWSPILNPEAGYNKIGDMYYAVIKYIVSLS